MKHFLVKYSIRDGECEYGDQTFTEANDVDSACEAFEKELKSWFGELPEYRIAKLERVIELPEEHYQILKLYI